MALGESGGKVNTARFPDHSPGMFGLGREGKKSSLPCKRSKYDVEEGINPGPKMSFLQLGYGV